MTRTLIFAAALLASFCSTLQAQRVTHFIWALDHSSPPQIHVYDPEGTTILSISVPGSGQARALCFGPDGSCYVARGFNVHKLDRTGSDLGVTLAAPAANVQATDVVARDDGEVFVTWANSQQPALARIARYNGATGMLLEDIQDPLMDFPRRLVVDPNNPTRFYVANRTNSQILFFDDIPGSPTFGLVADLSGDNIGPIGLAYDTTRNSLWVGSDYAQTQEIGLVDTVTTPSGFTTALTYGGGAITGLTAPSGLCFDRFRLLYVAGRSQNMGTAGVYIFDASVGNSPQLFATFPLTGTQPTNLIDVDVQPIEMETCFPLENGIDPILEAGAANLVKFRAPDAPGALYFAALSSPWPDSCVPYVPGVLDTNLTFLAPETRGVPATFDCIFWLTLGVENVGDPPILGAPLPSLGCGPFMNITNLPGFTIQGFRGFLDANGEATAVITMPPDPGLDGLRLSLAWLTLDPTTTQMIGLISNGDCVTLRFAPAGVVLCP